MTQGFREKQAQKMSAPWMLANNINALLQLRIRICIFEKIISIIFDLVDTRSRKYDFFSLFS